MMPRRAPTRPEAALRASRGRPDLWAPVQPTTRVPVTRVGRPAARAMADDREWRVCAVFRRSFYCRSAPGALVLVGPERLGAGPLHVLWAEGSDVFAGVGVEEGMRVGIDCDGARDGVAEPLTLELRDAREWAPPAAPRWQPSSLRRSLDWLAENPDRPPTEGLGRLLAPVASGRIDRAGAGDSSLLQLARPALAALAGWIHAALGPESMVADPPDAIAELVGLGPGLTPSGDDVLAGAFIALHGFARVDVAERLEAWLRPRVDGRTGLVSRAHLACAAEGEGATVLHDALAALALGDAPTLVAATSAVGTLGHCSGWDGLVGIAAAATAWLAASADDEGRSTPCR
jgi:hypothetical protein